MGQRPEPIMNHIHRLLCNTATFWRSASSATVVLVLAVGAGSAVWGQDQPPVAESKPIPATTATPVALPASQITLKAQETVAVLRSLRDRPIIDKPIEEIRDALPLVLGYGQEFLGQTEALLSTSISERKFDDLHRRWTRVQERIRGWREKVNHRAESLDRDLQTLQELRTTWEATLASAGVEGFQASQVAVIQRSIEDVRVAEERFGKGQAEILSIQMQIRKAEDYIQDATLLIARAKESATSPLLAFGAPPLWKVEISEKSRAANIQQLKAIWHDSHRDFLEFIQQEEQTLIRFLTLLVGLALVMAYLKSRAARLEILKPLLTDDPRPAGDPDTLHLELARHMLARPISAALLTTSWLVAHSFPDAPRILDDLLVVLMLIPLLRLLPLEFRRRYSGSIYALVALNVFALGIGLLPHLAFLHRLTLLLLTTATFVVLRRWLRAPGSDPQTRSARPVRVAARLAQVGLALAIVCNVFGGVSPASIITSGVLLSALVGVGFYVFYHVIKSALWIIFRSPWGQRSRMIKQHSDLVFDRATRLLQWVFGLFWAWKSLDLIQARGYAVKAVDTILNSSVSFGDISVSLMDIAGIVIVFWCASLASRLIRFVLEEDVYWRFSLARGVPNAISTALHYVIMFVGFILAIAAAGIDLDKFTILAGAFGVGIGFGMQDVVNNFVSGLILIVERPIMPGDTVQMGEIGGEVTRIGMRSSTIRTWEGSEMIVPNGQLVSKELVNWTLSDRMRRIDVKVGVAYGTDVQQVLELLVAVAKDHPDVEEMPGPYALFLGFGDSSLNFELRSWISRSERFVGIRSEVAVKVERAIGKAGITIPFPQRDLHIKSDARGEAK
jgi:potassium efflux system protein